MVLPIMEAEIPLNDTETEVSTTKNYRKQSRRGTVRQIIACLIANTSVLGPSMGLGYSAVALEPISSSDSNLKVTADELSWIASITAIATPIGCILASLSMRRGRRFGMMITSAVSATGWLVIYLANNVDQILVGRGICGVAMGLASVPATVYAAEISAPKLRGIVVTWTSVSIATGILIVYIFGYIFQTNWRLVALLSGVLPIISIILVATKMPESPVWLRSVGRGLEAEKILKKFHGLRKKEVHENGNEIVEEIKRRDFGTRGGLLARENLMPFLIMLGFFFFQQFSGIFVVVYYAVDFTLEAGVKIDGYLAAILIGITRLFGTIVVSYISRKFGRRIPSIASGTGMTIFMGILSVYLWLRSIGYEVNDHGVIPVLSILMYILTSTMGFLVLPFAMIGELYPSKFKDVLSGITTCFAYIFSFFVLKIYPDMLKAFDKHGVFFFYGLMSFIGTIFVILFLPETKGRSLKEIEESFKNKKLKDHKNPKNNQTEINDEEDKMESQTILENVEIKILNGENEAVV